MRNLGIFLGWCWVMMVLHAIPNTKWPEIIFSLLSMIVFVIATASPLSIEDESYRRRK